MDTKIAIDNDAGLEDLVERAQQGDDVVLTREGKVVARIVPDLSGADRSESIAAMERIIEMGKSISFAGIPVKELTHGGHKY
ncbi:MAG: hypothetical protein Q7T08_13955 [Devosia sp.]|nr:hypothetical protein [Devosia sp.]